MAGGAGYQGPFGHRLFAHIRQYNHFSIFFIGNFAITSTLEQRPVPAHRHRRPARTGTVSSHCAAAMALTVAAAGGVFLGQAVQGDENALVEHHADDGGLGQRDP
jgi:hypothetical protein